MLQAFASPRELKHAAPRVYDTGSSSNHSVSVTCEIVRPGGDALKRVSTGRRTQIELTELSGVVYRQLGDLEI